VEISDLGGTWEGVRGLIARLDGADRVTIEAILPSRQMRLTLPAAWLEPVHPQPLKRRLAGGKSRTMPA
jgi:hypothetical protein